MLARRLGWRLALVGVIGWSGLAAGLLTTTATEALAGVRTAPKAQGSLERTFRHCDVDRDADLVVKECNFAYLASSPFADDPRSFSVEWLQISVKPRRGWCFAGAHGSIRQSNARIGAWTPNYVHDAGPGLLAEVEVASEGRSIGRVAQRFALSFGSLTGGPEHGRRGDRLRWRWQGRTQRRVTLVVGAGFAHDPSGEGSVTARHEQLKSTAC